MASTISAGTTSGTAIAIAGDTTGNLAFTTQAGTYTQTLPNATGTVMVSGNMPAFSAYINTAQTISNATNTKVQNGVENFDTNNCFDSTTNYRFTPTVAGYYQVNANLTLNGASATTVISCFIYKNNTTAVVATQTPFNATGSYVTATCSTVLYMNGTTDYIEQYVWQNSGSTLTVLTGRPDLNSFSASLVRAA
jgi:hypothetical protein